MKRLFFLMVVLLAGAVASVQAALDANKDGKVTLEEYVAAQKASAEKKGVAFKEESVKKAFAKKDLDKDGVLSTEELKPAPKKAE